MGLRHVIQRKGRKGAKIIPLENHGCSEDNSATA
jgi:hypothetical protein